MSGWTNPVCDSRWRLMYPSRAAIGGRPVRVTGAEREACVFCGELTDVYVRMDPETLPSEPEPKACAREFYAG